MKERIKILDSWDLVEHSLLHLHARQLIFFSIIGLWLPIFFFISCINNLREKKIFNNIHSFQLAYTFYMLKTTSLGLRINILNFIQKENWNDMRWLRLQSNTIILVHLQFAYIRETMKLQSLELKTETKIISKILKPRGQSQPINFAMKNSEVVSWTWELCNQIKSNKRKLQYKCLRSNFSQKIFEGFGGVIKIQLTRLT